MTSHQAYYKRKREKAENKVAADIFGTAKTPDKPNQAEAPKEPEPELADHDLM